ncbi:hypothetical protein L6R52_11930 [Myxococcota bacterium]|nr:hypothetical protein [Myxococcota bacterium]
MRNSIEFRRKVQKSAGICVLALALVACSEPAPLRFGNGWAEGDPEIEGQALFLGSTFGVEVLGSWPPAEFLVGLAASEPDVFGDQFSKFGFIPDPTDDLPLGLKRGEKDPTRVHETCALCHVSALPDGTLWLGAPSQVLDLDHFRLAVDERWVAAGNPSMLTDLEREKLRAYGPGRTAADSSNYYRPVPADFPPYFNLSERTHMNYMGTGQNLRTEAVFSLYAFGAGAPNAREARVKLPPAEVLDPFLSFLGALDPPPAPPTDPALVARGRAVFDAERCGTCHHVGDLAADEVTPLDTSTTARDRVPGDDPAWPRGSIATSRLHRVLQDGDPDDPNAGADDDRIGDYLELIFENGLAIRRTDGYRVSDLRGLAYTAPYLHNGSVPTLDDLLRPAAERPATFTRGTFTIDTTIAGNGNGGHEFGVTLSAEDRAALVEYLRSLD